MGTNPYQNHIEVTTISVIICNRHKSLSKMIVWVLSTLYCTQLHFAIMPVYSAFVTLF